MLPASSSLFLLKWGQGVRSSTDEDVWRLQERNSLYLMIWWTLMGFGLSNFCLFDLGFNIGVTSLLIAFPFLKCGQGGQTMFGVCRKESLSHSYLMGLHLKNFRLSGLCLFYLGFWSDIGAGSSHDFHEISRLKGGSLIIPSLMFPNTRKKQLLSNAIFQGQQFDHMQSLPVLTYIKLCHKWIEIVM